MKNKMINLLSGDCFVNYHKEIKKQQTGDLRFRKKA